MSALYGTTTHFVLVTGSVPQLMKPATTAVAARRSALSSGRALPRTRSRTHIVLRRRAVQCYGAIGIYFGSTTGHTAEMADAIKDSLGDAGADPVDVGEIDGPAELSDFDALVVGVPTWHTGADSERSGTAWDDFLDEIKQMDSLKGKPVAVFGCGDSVGYGDNFCDAIEEIHDSFAEAGCNMIGYTDPSTYDFGESKSIRDGNFLGLPLDYENEYDECDSRIEKWVLQILEEI